MKSFIFADSGVISLLHLFVCISVIKPKIDVQRTFLIGSDVDVNIFSALRSIPSGTIAINLKSCILNRHKLRQSQIVTLPSQFVICRNLWSKPWRRKLSPTTLKTCSVCLGDYPCSLLTWIWKFTFLPILVLFHWYICLCVCISVIKPIIDVQTGWPRSGWPQVGHFDQKIKVNQIASYCAMLYPRCCSLWPCTFWGLHSSDFDSSAGQTRGSHFNFYWGTDTTIWSYVHFLCSCITKIDFYHLL